MRGAKKDIRFDKRAARYDDGFEGRFSRRFYSLLLNNMELRAGEAVLDVGCGTGALLRAMVDKFAVNGYGVDVEQAMIEEARRKCPGMDIQAARCEALPFADETFDAVTACMAYHHFADKDGFAREAARVLKPGGRLYIADPRFPAPVRVPLNALMRLCGVTGEVITPEGMAARFTAYGFTPEESLQDAYAQAVKLIRR